MVMANKPIRHAELCQRLDAVFGPAAIKSHMACWTLPGSTSDRTVRVWLCEAESAIPIQVWATRPASDSVVHGEVASVADADRLIAGVRAATQVGSSDSLSEIYAGTQSATRVHGFAAVALFQSLATAIWTILESGGLV